MALLNKLQASQSATGQDLSSKREPDPDRPPLAHRIVSDGERVGFACAYIPGMETVFKQKLGAWWLPQARMWVAQVGRIKQLGGKLDELFSGYEWKVKTRGLAFMAAKAMEKARPGCFSYALNIRLLPLENGQTVIISDYDRVLRQHLEQAGEWHASHSCFLSNYKPQQIANFLGHRGVFADSLYTHPTPLADFDPADWLMDDRPRLKVGEGAEMDFTGSGQSVYKKALEIIGKPMEELPVDMAVLGKAVKDFGLYDYQHDGVLHLIKHSSSLLADDMGLGKTRQATVAAILRRVDGLANLIVSPASMRIGWEREIKALLPGAKVWQIGEPWLEKGKPEWAVTSFEGLGAVLGQKFGVMVIDEAHYLKEMGSARTCNAFLIDAQHKYLLTGTPVLNVERELHTLLKLGGHPIGRLPVNMFERMFAGNKILRRQLGEHMKSWMLRRTKDLVLSLPGKQRQFIPIAPAGDFVDQYEELRDDNLLLPMVKIGCARQLLETAKVNWVSDYVGGLHEDDKIIVFCQYKQSIGAFQSAFQSAGIEYVTLTGEHNMKQRQESIDQFQANPKKRIFLATIDAAYVAITLTAANYVVFASQPLTPGKMSQAEDRAYRNGQKRKVTVAVPHIPGTLDDSVIKLLDHKRKLAAEVMLEEGAGPEATQKAEEKAAVELAEMSGLISKVSKQPERRQAGMKF